MSKVNALRNSPLYYCMPCLIYMETKLIYSKPSMYFKNSKTIKKNKSTHFLMRSVTFTTFSQQIIAAKLLSDQI